MRLTIGLLGLLLVCGCIPLMTPEQAAAENQRIDREEEELEELESAGEISPLLAEWRREDLARQREQVARDAAFYAFDASSVGVLLAEILGAGGVAAGVMRLHRGKRRDPEVWRKVEKLVNGGGGAGGAG